MAKRSGRYEHVVRQLEWRASPDVPPGKAYSPSSLQAKHVVLLATDEYSLKPQLVSPPAHYSMTVRG